MAMTHDERDDGSARSIDAFTPEASDDHDFADEHDDTSFDDLEGGPEHSEEPESPHGHSGLD